MDADTRVIKLLAVKDIAADANIQPRANGLHGPTVDEYAAEMEAGTEFPPLVVYRDTATGTQWLSQGFHRLAAAIKAKLAKIACEVRKGTRRDAMIDAAGSNRHGLKRTNADKRRAVEMLLTEFPDWSNRRVAEAVGVDDKTVAQLRKSAVEPSGTDATTREGKDGRRRPATRATESEPEKQGQEAPDEVGNETSDQLRNSAVEVPEPEEKPADTETAPEHPADVFCGRINRLCRLLDGAKAEVVEIAADPFGKHVHAESVTLQIDAARKALWQSRPTEPCNCVRDGADPHPACKACYGFGRTTASRVLKGGR